jgi:hypothetical protein
MGQLSYLGVLAFCVVGTVWLEVVLLTRVFARAPLPAAAPVAALFICWDVYAISRSLDLIPRGSPG